MNAHIDLPIPIHTEIKDKPAKKKRKVAQIPNTKFYKQGRWTPDEHSRYNRAYELYNKDWKKISESVGTRTSLQVRSHNQKMEEAKKKEKHRDKQKIVYDFLADKEKEVMEELQLVKPAKEPKKLVIAKELARYLEAMFGPILTPDFILNKQHLKLFGINKMRHNLLSSQIVPGSIPQALPNPDSHPGQSNSVIIEEERPVGDSAGTEANNAIEYNISQPLAFMSLSL